MQNGEKKPAAIERKQTATPHLMFVNIKQKKYPKEHRFFKEKCINFEKTPLQAYGKETAAHHRMG